MNKLKTINIKGKEYVQVHERILAFHNLYPKGSITSKYELHGNMWIVIATITPNTEFTNRMFTGMAQEIIGEGMVNKTSALENAETSAVGRALGMLGIGILEGIASADEVVKAQNRTYAPADTSEMVKLKTNWIADPDKRKEQNDKIKKLGGKWNADEKSWFIPKNLKVNMEDEVGFAEHYDSLKRD